MCFFFCLHYSFMNLPKFTSSTTSHETCRLCDDFLVCHYQNYVKSFFITTKWQKILKFSNREKSAIYQPKFYVNLKRILMDLLGTLLTRIYINSFSRTLDFLLEIFFQTLREISHGLSGQNYPGVVLNHLMAGPSPRVLWIQMAFVSLQDSIFLFNFWRFDVTFY